jgi:hypothetical protein
MRCAPSKVNLAVPSTIRRRQADFHTSFVDRMYQSSKVQARIDIGAHLAKILDLFGEDSRRNVYAGEPQVRPPGAPTIQMADTSRGGHARDNSVYHSVGRWGERATPKSEGTRPSLSATAGDSIRRHLINADTGHGVLGGLSNRSTLGNFQGVIRNARERRIGTELHLERARGC